MRDDITSEGQATKDVRDFLVRIGGKNPHSEPNYRVVLAKCRLWKQGGEWTDWREEADLQARGGFVQNEQGEKVLSPEHPLRVVKELRTVPRYSICTCEEGVLLEKGGRRSKAGDCTACGGVRGWIIEHWTPPHAFAGSEQEWYAKKVEGTDIPCLGPYPHDGEYLRIPNSKATASVPSMSQLAELVFFLEGRKASMSHPSPEQYIRDRVYAMEQEDKRQREAIKQRNRELIREWNDPLHGSSLRAGAERERMAQQIRNRGGRIGHCGN